MTIKLIFCYWGNMTEDEFIEAFRCLGHEVIPFEFAWYRQKRK